MDIKSLMIGDWVYDTLSQTNIKVNRGCFEINPLNGIGYEENLIPIPLTRAILEKNGFEDYDSYATLDTEKYRVIYAFDGFLTIVDDDKQRKVSYLECDYVHHLQHTLRLCGIEKTIEL